MCLSRGDAPTDIQHDQMGHHVISRALDLRSNFDIDFLGQHAYVFTSDRDFISYLRKAIFVKNAHFDISWLP